MVSFRPLLTSAMALAAAPAMAALTPAQVIQNINIITTKSKALQAPAKSINIINGPLIIIGQGPLPGIIVGFQDIISVVKTDIEAMGGSAPVTDVIDATKIADAFREFVIIHQQLLNILIGKSGLFATVPFIGQPIAAILRGLEAVVDAITFGIIDMVEVRAQSARLTADAVALDSTIETAIKSYSGIV